VGKNKGKDLIALGYTLASALAEGKTVDEINVLSSFFMLVADTLALTAAKTALCENLENENTKTPQS